MRRLFLVALLAATACASSDGNKKDPDEVTQDTGEPGQLPPSSCPVGDLALTKADLRADEALFAQWNELRADPGDCAGTSMDAAAPLDMDASLMWVARCWAFDLSMLGEAPPADDQFSDGTTLADAATDMGYPGFLNSWAIVGQIATPEDAFTQWLDGGGTSCENLWTQGSSGAAAWSDAGGVKVAVRISALDAR